VAVVTRKEIGDNGSTRVIFGEIRGKYPSFFGDAMQHKDCAMFVQTLLHSATIAHQLHLSSKSYSEHKALAKYYENIEDVVDALVESYQGKYGLIESYPTNYHNSGNKSALAYMESLQKFVGEARGSLPQDSELQNEIDNIVNLINSTVYKLKFLR